MPPRTQQMTFHVKYVNEAKNDSQYGSIADGNRTYVSVPVDLLGNFKPGVAYNINYTERTVNGRTFKNFYSFADGPTQTASITAAPSGPAPKSEFRLPVINQSKEQERKDMLIFVTGVVGRAMGSGSFMADDIKNLTMEAKAAYKDLVERGPQPTGELEDEIPY